MLSWIRERFGKAVVIVIVVGIGLSFILSDFLGSRITSRLGGTSGLAGTVNGEAISASEFHRELNRRTESLKQMMGGKISDEQLKMFGIRQSVFNELVQRKLILQDSKKNGLLPTDAQVREKIQELPYFKKDGKFDFLTYQSVLKGNNLDPGKFEGMIRDDLTLQRWLDQVRSRVRVSEDEVQRDFRLSNEKRNVKYVVLDLEAGKKSVVISPAEIDGFLKDSEKLGWVKTRYEQGRTTQYKTQKFEAVQREIARELIVGDKVGEARKANERLADELVPLLGTAADSRVQSMIKPLGVTIKASGLISGDTQALPGISDPRGILQDAFSEKNPIYPKGGGKAKRYDLAGAVVVAVVVESKTADLTKLAAESKKLEEQIRTRKERELQENWLEELKSRAKIDMESKIVNGPGGESDVG
ncbi:MAG: SurA N-terminal domain-containing protein [Bdellovibrionales bacterium]|nr:SurA N-terminal domain-containing protein [Bdellovibrionales bacterium]